MADKDDKAGNETANEVRVKPCKPKQSGTVERITNDEKVEVNENVNKKLTAMSKEAKTRKKKKLQKPPKDESSVSPMSNNKIFLVLGVVGVIIAGVSIYYQRKSVMKMCKKEQKKVEPEVHVPHDERDEPIPENDSLIKW